MLRTALGLLAALVIWTGIVAAGTIGGWWRTPLAPPGDPRAFAQAAVARIEAARPGNVAFVLLERGRPVAAHFASKGEPVDGRTRFQVASLSKWITAWGVMALVEQGKLDLDAPVTRYLTRWRLPPGAFDTDGVTVRRLLSHTAGLTDGLGYAGFAPDARVQTLEESLTQAADASPGASGAVRVGQEPGSAFLYSGGGYTLLQLVIEEVSGQPFDAYMKAAIFAPLGMRDSTFVLEPDAANVAQSFDGTGASVPLRTFTALAASSLYTTADDLTRFLAAQVAGDGAPAGRGVLTPETLAAMRQPQATQFGFAVWGLGAILYVPNGADDFVIGHDGREEPAINTTARVDPATGDGIVLLESGDPLLATRIGGAWVFWRTGEVDMLTVMDEAGATARLFAAGAAAIVIAAIGMAWLRRRRR